MRLGEHPDYRRLVKRGGHHVTAPLTLGQVAHEQYHEAVYRARLAQEDTDVVDEGEPSAGNDLPAGPESSWVLAIGGRKPDPADYPRGKVRRYIERGDEEAGVIRAVLAGLDALREYEPHGEALRLAVLWCCVVDEPRMARRRGWRHEGEGFDAAKDALGGTGNVGRWLSDAWEVLGALASEPEVVAAARKAGAAEERAVAWVSARG